MNVSELIENRKKSLPSVGEKKVIKFLRSKHIKFKREYWFQGLVNKRTGYPLFFDFYIPSHNLIIEVDGLQHFKPVYGVDILEAQKDRDKQKNKFCKESGIIMCRLLYSDLKTMKKLTKFLSQPKKDKKPYQNGAKKKSKNIRPTIVKVKKDIKQKIGKRVNKKALEMEAALERKRNKARMNYPTDIRLYIAEKIKNNATH